MIRDTSFRPFLPFKEVKSKRQKKPGDQKYICYSSSNKISKIKNSSRPQSNF